MMVPLDELQPDVFFSAGYGRAAAMAVPNGQWDSISLAGGSWQLPFVLRSLPSGRRDAISPYGYSGIYCAEEVTDPNELWGETKEVLRRRGIISLFLRNSPLVSTYTPPSALTVVNDHTTYFLPCGDEVAAWERMDGRARTAIRKALKNGVSTEFIYASESEFADLSDFRRLYDQTMDRVAATPEYYFDEEYYEALFSELGKQLIVAKALRQGEVIAASLFLEGTACVHYHLSGSTPLAAKLGATNLILWEAWRHSNSIGAPGLHLGGGVSEGDGLSKFKKSFGGRALSYSAHGLIVDEGGYQAELAATAIRLECDPRDLVSTNFFPAYRAPASSFTGPSGSEVRS